jgi:hypothetical protein
VARRRLKEEQRHAYSQSVKRQRCYRPISPYDIRGGTSGVTSLMRDTMTLILGKGLRNSHLDLGSPRLRIQKVITWQRASIGRH